jgi:hypothetical protein
MGQTKIAIFGQSISKGLKVSKGDSVVLSEIKNGMALGFNQNTGSQGTVPIAIFEAPTVVVDFGTNAIRIGYFDNGFRPILNDQGQLNRTCRFAFDDGWKFKMISSNQSIKGLKTWIRTSSMQDFYFQLSGVTARFDGQMLFETGHTSIGIGELLELLFKEIKKDADAEYSRYKVNAASILVILPHRWTYYQKSLVKQAARSAGFYKVSVSCPSVALAYALEKPKLSSIMISIGAGFTEIALVNQQQVVDIAGKELGGNSFTRAIYTHVIRHNNLELGILESRQLFNECEVAKKALCFAEYADIPLFNGQVYRLEKRMLSSIFEVLLG